MAMSFSPVRTVAPAAEVITLAEAKAHLRVDFGDDDVLISALIKAVTSHLDGWTGILGRCLLNQTWVAKYDSFPATKARDLPFGNLSSVTVTYYDLSNNLQTLSSDLYTLVNTPSGGYVCLDSDSSWPLTYDRVDAVSVTLVAGFGASALDVPMAIRQAMLLLIGHWYENREASIVGTNAMALPVAVDALLTPFRQVGT